MVIRKKWKDLQKNMDSLSRPMRILLDFHIRMASIIWKLAKKIMRDIF